VELNSPVLLSTAYLPPVAWFAAVASSGAAQIEACESFQKQSYRNRCKICSADGAQTLQVPVQHGGSRLIRDIRIDYGKNWLHLHRSAIATAYGPSPFYKYYWDELDAVLERRHEFLFDLNAALTEKLIDMLHLKASLTFTGDYCSAPEGVRNLRGAINPKREPAGSPFKEYYQVFVRKLGFIPNLSIIDLLFCEGPEAYRYL
jgi:hypothetical protein